MIRVRDDRVYELLSKNGWSKRRLAREIGVDATYVCRVLNHRISPSARFVSGFLSVFPYTRFEEVFKVS